MAYQLFSRERLLAEALKVEKWDVIIIGGGATGLGIALDSTTRGFKTLLLEQIDFAKGTSSRSTKLVHGGIRYLAQGNIELVKEALHERGLLAKNAPHLVKKQMFVIPNYQWWEGMYYNVGLKTYDFLAGKLSMGKSEKISREEVISRFDTLVQEDLRGGVVYLDGQFDDSRLAVNIAQTCIENGAIALNHFKVTGMFKNEEGKLSGVEAEDGETGKKYEFNAKLVVNATGVFADYLRKLANPEARLMIRASQGVHLVFDKKFFPGKDALMIPRTDDGRVLFAVPWKNKVLVGTTDTLLEKPKIEPKALEKEIQFILETFNHYIQNKVTRADVQSIFAGLRPLAGSEDEDKETKEISRGHKIMLGENGLLSIIGGKWTTYRKMAEDTLDFAIAHEILEPEKCITEDFLIHGAKSLKSREDHLSIYGSDRALIENLIIEKPELGEKLLDRIPNIKAEVVWAVHYEMARTLEDVLARRLRVLFLDSEAAVEIAPNVAVMIANELGKDAAWAETQIAEFLEVAANYRIKSFKLNE
ncbi:glycerol-3-phosphate dehydrogenase/oxidase [Gramella sp. AN32]|uniref:Glycerol-3-phosphate dehydrogenase/oxidase n=1 Tax=Christiangramia antarctica TaxID=2058158 RepID=A0ABW5X1N4_9FLAO|nr:glycerol-3-phosphate dehydrogenase/oxidase [Gramella sp. AN32]